MSHPPLSVAQLADLAIQGFLIVPKVMDERVVEHCRYLFYEWLPDNYALATGGNQRIITHRTGHTNLAWFCRTDPKIQAIYRQLLECTDLVTNFQGCGYNPRITKPGYRFVRCDQSPVNEEMTFSSFVSLTKNIESTIQVVPGSHEEENSMFLEGGLLENGKESDEPQVVPTTYMRHLVNRLLTVNVNPGDLVIWDSRLLYQETYGPELRIVQYLSFSNKDLVSCADSEKREEAYTNYRATKFRASPIRLERLRRTGLNHTEGIMDQENPSGQILELVV